MSAANESQGLNVRGKARAFPRTISLWASLPDSFRTLQTFPKWNRWELSSVNEVILHLLRTAPIVSKNLRLEALEGSRTVGVSVSSPDAARPSFHAWSLFTLVPYTSRMRDVPLPCACAPVISLPASCERPS